MIERTQFLAVLAGVVNDMSWGFLVAPVGVGVLLLAAFAYAWHNLVAHRAQAHGVNKSDTGANTRGDTWPTRWW